MTMDAARAARVLAYPERGRGSRSVRTSLPPVDVARVASGRADAALIGEALMRARTTRDSACASSSTPQRRLRSKSHVRRVCDLGSSIGVNLERWIDIYLDHLRAERALARNTLEAYAATSTPSVPRRRSHRPLAIISTR